jgi:hypothetical protein
MTDVDDRPAPAERLGELLGGYRRTALVHLAARLALADHLADGPRTSAELAEVIGARPGQLHQIARALVGIGVLCDDNAGDEHRFALTEVGELLRGDHPRSQRGAAIYFGGTSYRAYSGLADAISTGGIAFDLVFGMPYYDYLDENPELAEYYHQLIALPGAGHAINGLFEFSRHHTLVDVGGGSGTLLADILFLNPDLRGILHDLAVSAPMAHELLAERGVADRCAVESGDFRVSVPAGGDVYLLCRVLANWPHDVAVKILTNCRQVMPPGSRLLVFEMVMPERVTEGTFTVEGDLNALAHMGGAVRTWEQFGKLFEDAGLRLERVRRVHPDAHWTLLEATPERVR